MPFDEVRELAQEGGSGSFFQNGKEVEWIVISIHYLSSEQIIASMSS